MYGRYGSDQLNLFLAGCCLTFIILSSVLRFFKVASLPGLLSGLAYVCIIIELFRMFSRNYDKRRRENAWFMEKAGPLVHGVRQKRAQMMDKDHCYFRCPSCGQVLRVPKGKGKISVRCRSCGCSFQKKS